MTLTQKRPAPADWHGADVAAGLRFEAVGVGPVDVR